MRLLSLLVLLTGCSREALDGRDQPDLPQPPDLGSTVGPTPPRTIALQVGAPRELAVDRVHHRLYWNDLVQGLIVRAAIDGSDRQTVDQGDSGFGYLSVANGSAYWSGFDTKQVRTTPLDAIAPTTLIWNVYVRYMIVGADGITYSDDDRIALFYFNGAPTVTLVTSDHTAAYQSLVRTDGGDLLVMTQDFHDLCLLNQLVDGALQPITKIPIGTMVGVPGALYFQSDSAVSRLALADDSLQTIAPRADGNQRGGQLALDDAWLYFVDSISGDVRRASRSDGSVTTLASGQLRPQGIAVDDQYVYWSTFGDGLTTNGTIVRLALP